MPRLRIELSGFEIQVFCGEFSNEVKQKLIDYCEKNDEYIESVFYYEDSIMEEITSKEYWEIDEWARFVNDAGIADDDTRLYFEIYLDDKQIKFDQNKFKREYVTVEKPKPSAEHIAVSAGIFNKGIHYYETEYRINLMQVS